MQQADNLKDRWEESYLRKENFLFYPHEEIIRFFSKYIVRRTGVDRFDYIGKSNSTSKVLDLGCGIGRHLVFAHQMKIEAYGIDLSEEAVGQARSWALKEGMSDAAARVVVGDISNQPFADGFFDFVVSHGVLDSMHYSICAAAVKETARVTKVGGLFYCDVISGDDSAHYREFSGEEVVHTLHEQNTIQLYFNFELIKRTFEPYFHLKEVLLIRKENILTKGYISRYHLILERK